jgi:hypothetical protein
MATLLLNCQIRWLVVVPLLLLTTLCMGTQWSGEQRLRAEHNPRKRAELALSLASDAFTSASRFYEQGDADKGDAELDDMTKNLKECLSSLREAHRGGNSYHKAELKVASLQRRLHDLIGNISLGKRGWAQQTERTVDAIHDQLLAGVMKK